MNVTLPSRQSQNKGLTTSCLPYVTRCSNNKILPKLHCYRNLHRNKLIIKEMLGNRLKNGMGYGVRGMGKN